MTMRSVRLGIVAALLGAVLVGAWLLARSSAPDPVYGSDHEESPGRAALEEEGEVSADRAASRPDADAGPLRLALAGDDEPVREEPVEEDVLVGRVVDEIGVPVPGATVHACTGTLWRALPLDMESDGVQRLWPDRMTTETDEEGRFGFAGDVEPGPLQLAIRAPGYRPRYEDHLRLPDRLPHDLGDFTLEPGSTLGGRVVDSRGEGIVGATLLQAIERGVAGMRVTVAGRGISLATTTEGGRFRIDQLASGPWRLIVDAPGYQVGEADGHIAKRAEQTGLTITLELGESIAGTLEGAAHDRLGQLRVEARPRLVDEADPAAVFEDEAHPRARRSPFDASGAFRLDGLAPRSNYLLTVWERNHAGEWNRAPGIEPVEARPGATDVRLTAEPAATIVFHVVDATTGSPLTDFVVWAGVGGVRALRDENDEVLSIHPDGRVRYGELRPDEGGEEVTVKVRAVGYREHRDEGILIARGEERDLGAIELEPAPAVVVLVRDSDTGDPVAGARVFLTRPDDNSLRWYLGRDDSALRGTQRFSFGITDDDGRARLAALPDPEALLRVHSAEHAPSAPREVFAAGPSDSEELVELGPGATVVVHVEGPGGEPTAGASVLHRMVAPHGGADAESLMRPDEEERVTAGDGAAVFAHLSPGDHAFKLEVAGAVSNQVVGGDEPLDDSWTRVFLSAEAEEEVRLFGEARARLSGTVTEAGLPLAGASLVLRDEGADASKRFRVPASDPFSTLSAHDGRFCFEGVPSGAYVLIVEHAERRMSEYVAVDVPPEGAEIEVVLTIAIVEGRVVDRDGHPLEGVEIRVSELVSERREARRVPTYRLNYREDEEGRLRPDRNVYRRPKGVLTGRDGRYSLRGLATLVPLHVEASGGFVTGASTQISELAPGELREGANFTLDVAGQVEVSVEGGMSKSLRVVMELRDGQDKTLQRSSTSLWGTRQRRLSSLRSGRWVLTASIDKDGSRVVIAQREVEVLAGQVSQVVLPAP